jgi:hypothetical protein
MGAQQEGNCRGTVASIDTFHHILPRIWQLWASGNPRYVLVWSRLSQALPTSDADDKQLAPLAAEPTNTTMHQIVTVYSMVPHSLSHVCCFFPFACAVGVSRQWDAYPVLHGDEARVIDCPQCPICAGRLITKVCTRLALCTLLECSGSSASCLVLAPLHGELVLLFSV